MFRPQRNWKLETRNYDVCSARSVVKTVRILVDDHRRMLSFGGEDFSFRPHLAEVAVIGVGPRFLTEEFVQSPLIISRLLGDFLQQNLHGPVRDFCRCAIFPGHSYYLYLLSVCPAHAGLPDYTVPGRSRGFAGLALLNAARRQAVWQQDGAQFGFGGCLLMARCPAFAP
jgi:hypothetical protein